MRVHLRSPSFFALHKLCGEQLARGGIFLQKDLGQAQFAVVDVVFEAPDGECFDLPCEVLQAFPGTATALSIKASGRPGLDALLAHAMTQKPDGADGALDVAIDEDEGTDGAHAEAVEVGDGSLIQQVQAMSVAEKRQAAMKGNKDLRLILIKDTNKTIHPFVMQNPAISLDEVETISRMTAVHPDVLHSIARNWAKNANIVRNLVKNPKTPMPDALQLVEKLAVTDLRAIAKGGSVRMAILQAARKRVTGA